MSACAVSRTVGSFLLLKAAACAVTASRGRQRGKRSSKCMRNPRSYARSLWVQAQVCVEGARGRGEPWNCRGALARLDESPRCHHPIDVTFWFRTSTWQAAAANTARVTSRPLRTHRPARFARSPDYPQIRRRHNLGHIPARTHYLHSTTTFMDR